ncbi:hypothetical protein AKJ09_09598 [Labilithrix luteola]|uniref:Uncharacterized protein n=1 Tax=Labilithrix luteola TaxID=1391654 RepID=A0A0K1QBX9_9BACT|nr:hypothetical protein AKJ09_09598 [Labilithrix luteola]
MLVGRHKRAFGETVGEATYGGGRARQRAGDPRDPASVEAAAAMAYEASSPFPMSRYAA